MAVLNREDFFNAVSRAVDGRTDDEAIKFVEDMSETYDALSDTGGGARVKELEESLRQNDEMWRQRYKARFFNGKTAGSRRVETYEIDEDGKLSEKIVIEDLYKTPEDRKREYEDKEDNA